MGYIHKDVWLAPLKGFKVLQAALLRRSCLLLTDNFMQL
jgi:hypothetical protein